MEIEDEMYRARAVDTCLDSDDANRATTEFFAFWSFIGKKFTFRP
jgi:hypothetical protein